MEDENFTAAESNRMYNRVEAETIGAPKVANSFIKEKISFWELHPPERRTQAHARERL